MIFEWILIGLAVLAAMTYGLLFARRATSAWGGAAKAAAVGALLALAVARGGPPLLTAALALSVLGEVLFVALPAIWLRAGLAAFLLAHISYMGLFLRGGGGRFALMAEPVRNLTVAAVFAVWVTLTVWLWSGSPRWRPAVVLYGAALAMMTASALTLSRYFWPAIAGALCLAVSNGLWAAWRIKQARSPVLTEQTVWWLYFAGQGMIAYACLR